MPILFARVTVARLVDPTLLLLVALGVALGLSAVGFGRSGTAEVSARARWAGRAAWAAWAGLWISALPIVASALMESLVVPAADLTSVLATTPASDVAIAVFGGGAGGDAPTPRERISGASALRVITAARVWSETKAALVVVTGSPDEAESMADLLIALGVPDERIVRDGAAANTRGNAENSAALFRARGLKTVIVVTSSAHVRRSVHEFARAGVRALAAPGGDRDRTPLTFDALLPSGLALGETYLALHEIVGYLR